jgi:archaeosine synthase beta-subunit
MTGSGMTDVPAATRLRANVEKWYDLYGQRKPMPHTSPAPNRPLFFLLRTFLGDNDLLVILNTKRCRYQCAFCRLPAKSTRSFVPDDAVLDQFGFVANELRHSLSVVDRVTLSNEGSVLDNQTLGAAALEGVVAAIGAMRRVRRIEFETRLEFVRSEVLGQLKQAAPRTTFGVLTGFETVDERIRNEVLAKREPLEMFRRGLDAVAAAGASLTAYVLVKPDPYMSDEEAYDEATRSISFLAGECRRRQIDDLTIRLNPMYRAVGSRWAKVADGTPRYAPPRLTDVMRVAEEAVTAHKGIRVYVGLSTEGLANMAGTYLAREDYSQSLIKYVKEFNDRQGNFPWDRISVELPAARDPRQLVQNALT